MHATCPGAGWDQTGRASQLLYTETVLCMSRIRPRGQQKEQATYNKGRKIGPSYFVLVSTDLGAGFPRGLESLEKP